MSSLDIQLVSLGHRDGVPVANVSVKVNDVCECVELEIASDLFGSLSTIMDEDPFPKKPQGKCTFHFIECKESNAGQAKAAKIEIRKGHSRTVRKLEVQRPLFLFLWNVLHFNTVPSKLPQEMRDH
jgi:hypothetical protein